MLQVERVGMSDVSEIINLLLFSIWFSEVGIVGVFYVSELTWFFDGFMSGESYCKKPLVLVE